MKIIAFIIMFSLQSQATEVFRFKNSWNLFSQKLGPGFELPTPITNRSDLSIQFEISDFNESTLKKVFFKAFEIENLKMVIEIYFLNQNSQRYFSQQVYLFKDGNLVSRCTAYFGLEQNYLVPGSCGGVVGDNLFGVAIYK